MNRKDHQHLNLLCDIGELAALLAGSENIENFLVGAEEALTRLTRKFSLDDAAGKGVDNAA
jgi:hypothetical protein